MANQTPSRDDILMVLEPRFPNAEAARLWFETEPVPGFSGATAAQLVDAGRGQEFLEFIAASDAGVFA